MTTATKPLTAGQKLKNRHEQLGHMQDRVNQVLSFRMDHASLGYMIQTMASIQHADFPQYNFHWNGWQLVQVTEMVQTKAGTAFMPYDYAVMDTFVSEGQPVTCYSLRLGCDVTVPADHVFKCH